MTQSVVRDGWQRFYEPEYIKCVRTSLSNGAYIDNILADKVQAKVILQSEEKMIGGLSASSFSDKAIAYIETLESLPATVTLPKMTKATSTALLTYPISFGLVKDSTTWEIAGYGLANFALSSLRGIYKNFFSVSSGIIAPLLNGQIYSLIVLKEKYVIFAQPDVIVICGTIYQEKQNA